MDFKSVLKLFYFKMDCQKIEIILDEIHQDIKTFEWLKITGMYTLIIHLKKCSDLLDLIELNEYSDEIKKKCLFTYKKIIVTLINYNVIDSKMIEILAEHVKYFQKNLRTKCTSHIFDELKHIWKHDKAILKEKINHF